MDSLGGWRSGFGPAIAFAALVLVASLVPVPETGGQTPTLMGLALDKWVHAGSYGLLTGLLAWGHQRRTLLAVGALAAVAVAFGAGVELLQLTVPSRSLSGLDFLANTAGALVVAIAWVAVGPFSMRGPLEQ